MQAPGPYKLQVPRAAAGSSRSDATVSRVVGGNARVSSLTDAQKQALKARSRARKEHKMANKKIKSAEALATAAGYFASDTRCVLTAVDLEWWEMARAMGHTGAESKVLEFGMASLAYDGSKPLDAGGADWSFAHYIVEENTEHRNGRFCADNRDQYLFGDSQTMPQAQAIAMCNDVVNRSDVLVFHDAKGDLDVLRALGVSVGDTPVADTQQLANARYAVDNCGLVTLLLGTAHARAHRKKLECSVCKIAQVQVR